VVPLHRCPRCRAEDISADAHPARVLNGSDVVAGCVCRNCYRAAELEFRIACETRGLPYAPLAIREGLRRLASFYRERLVDLADPALLVDEDERAAAGGPIRVALAEVERRLAVAPVE
jgi:hypothetical protein